jgi:hypothetical protein
MTWRWFCVGAWALAACGGGPSPPPDYTERSEAQEQCDTLMSAWCNSALECVASGIEPEAMLSEAEFAEQLSLCIDVARSTCDAASSVGERYEECRSSVEVLEPSDCEAVQTAVREMSDVPMPGSCAGLFVAN